MLRAAAGDRDSNADWDISKINEPLSSEWRRMKSRKAGKKVSSATE